jgi:NADP-dependent 3-hydroxy acid dehydrogenase YdfG
MQALMMTAVNAMGNIDVIFNSAGAQRASTV